LILPPDLAARGIAAAGKGRAENNLAAPFVLPYQSLITRDCE